VLSDQVADRNASFTFFQYLHDLRFAESRLLHRVSPCSGRVYYSGVSEAGELTQEPDLWRGHHGKRYTGGNWSTLQVDEGKLGGHADEVVRLSVEETLNALLEAEAGQICKAQRYERLGERVGTRADHYERKPETKAGEVKHKVPKLRRLPFETAIIERYKRREASVEEALVEMYLAGVSVRRVEDIAEPLWGTGSVRAPCRA
jgi:hypothetical protein